MTAEDFRRLALDLEGAVENAHMNHPDFRVGGKVFATLDYPKQGWGMVKLTPEQQHNLLQESSGTFQPAAGAWGRQGCTVVLLESVEATVMKGAIRLAWQGASEASKARSFKKKLGAKRSRT